MTMGDGLGIVALVLWMSVAVGPWWVGLGIFLAVWAINHSRKERA